MKSGFQKRHEISVNAFNLVVFKAPNISYEYLATENTSFGLALLYKIDRGKVKQIGVGSYELLYRIYSVTSYVRRYFSGVYARGFFIEGFGMLNSGEVADYINTYDAQEISGQSQLVQEVETYTNFALGITFGGKFLIGRKGVVFETHLGFGWHGIFGKNHARVDGVSRGGLSLGYRF